MNAALTLYHDTFSEIEHPELDIVLIHGWGMNSLVWDLVIPYLQKRFRVTVIDLPGFGQSPMPKGAFDLKYLAKHVLDVAPERALWVGWSLGGLVAMQAALMAPERIVGIMGVATSPKFIKDESVRHHLEQQDPEPHNWVGIPKQEFDTFSAWLNEDWQGSLIRFLALQCKGSQSQKNDIRFLRERVFHHGLPAPQALKAGLDILITTDFRAALATVAVPFEFILGAHDEVVPDQLADHLMTHYPQCEVHPLQGASHIPMVSHAWDCANFISQLAGKVTSISRHSSIKKQLAKKFGHAAKTYNNAAQVQYAAGLELIDRLAYYQNDQCADSARQSECTRALDLGCGTGNLVPYFLEQCSVAEYTGIDLSDSMIDVAMRDNNDARAQFQCADFDAGFNLNVDSDRVTMPQRFSLLLSNFSMQWSVSLQRTLKRVFHLAADEALFALTVPGTATFQELVKAWESVDGQRHVNQFYTMDVWRTLLEEVGFTVLYTDKRQKIEHYDSVGEALIAMRQSGITGSFGAQRKSLLGKQTYKNFLQAYEEQNELVNSETKIPLTYEIYSMIARRDKS